MGTKRIVRTTAGVKKYGVPVGSVIGSRSKTEMQTEKKTVRARIDLKQKAPSTPKPPTAAEHPRLKNSKLAQQIAQGTKGGKLRVSKKPAGQSASERSTDEAHKVIQARKKAPAKKPARSARDAWDAHHKEKAEVEIATESNHGPTRDAAHKRLKALNAREQKLADDANAEERAERGNKPAPKPTKPKATPIGRAPKKATKSGPSATTRGPAAKAWDAHHQEKAQVEIDTESNDPATRNKAYKRLEALNAREEKLADAANAEERAARAKPSAAPAAPKTRAARGTAANYKTRKKQRTKTKANADQISEVQKQLADSDNLSFAKKRTLTNKLRRLKGQKTIRVQKKRAPAKKA